uniref:Uncharacterized protein n=1 Tax=Kalanchoe fedtschenkoi TaxID=63787 RepID=A0A7N0TX68_KALFE
MSIFLRRISQSLDFLGCLIVQKRRRAAVKQRSSSHGARLLLPQLYVIFCIQFGSSVIEVLAYFPAVIGIDPLVVNFVVL